ncbi:MAG TPA: chemotaxis protein CheB [Alphaproteobacteria bacterium]
MYEAVVIGASAGGLYALRDLLSGLPKGFPAPIAAVQHIAPQSQSYMSEFLSENCALRVKEAEDKEKLMIGCVYMAPGGYHMMIEQDRTLSLSVDDKINFVRPAIDPLFESAARVYKSHLVGIILTGGNADGAMGLRNIKNQGGLAIVQDPLTAESPAMPQAAIDATNVDHILPIVEMAPLLRSLFDGGSNHAYARS